MAVATLIETVGGATSNTYATQAEGDQWDDNRPAHSSDDDWASASSGEKDEALLYAAKIMDAIIVWEGAVVNYTQSLLFPRQGLLYPSGEAVSTTEIPQLLKDAQCEFARQLITSNRTEDSDIETLGITRMKAGPVDFTFDHDVALKILPDIVYLLLPENWVCRIRTRARGTRKAVRV